MINKTLLETIAGLADQARATAQLEAAGISFSIAGANYKVRKIVSYTEIEYSGATVVRNVLDDLKFAMNQAEAE